MFITVNTSDTNIIIRLITTVAKRMKKNKSKAVNHFFTFLGVSHLYGE